MLKIDVLIRIYRQFEELGDLNVVDFNNVLREESYVFCCSFLTTKHIWEEKYIQKRKSTEFFRDFSRIFNTLFGC